MCETVWFHEIIGKKERDVRLGTGELLVDKAKDLAEQRAMRDGCHNVRIVEQRDEPNGDLYIKWRGERSEAAKYLLEELARVRSLVSYLTTPPVAVGY